MDKYYYLASELPFLAFGKDPHISREEFLNEAEKWVDEKNFMVLSGVDINDYSLDEKSPSSILKEYKEFEFALRSNVSSLRSSIKAGLKYEGPALLASLVKEHNPLEIEKRLLLLRWEFIEDKEPGHYFDLQFLILYLLKLQILERFLTFNKDKGFEKFKKLCEVNL